MIHSFKSFLFEDLKYQSGEGIVLAVSGGMDSMLLWYFLRNLKVDYIVAHCNFKLRGKESDEDEHFVQAFAEGKEKVFTRSFDTESYAAERGISIQMAARELRYAFFDELRAKNNCKYIATAHHLDDQIETFFIQLLRNKQYPGTSGMPVKTDRIIRPLMFLGRESIEHYIEQFQIPFRNDTSNDNEIYLRNRIRKSLIPVLQKTAPDFKNSILEVMSNMNELSNSFDEYIQKKKEDIVREDGNQTKISIDKLLDIDFPDVFLESILRKYGFNKQTVENILKTAKDQSGKVFYSRDFKLVKDRREFILSSLEEKHESIFFFSKNELLEVEDFFVHAELMNNADLENKKLLEGRAYLDFDVLDEELIFRRWEHGDVFTPLGMKGRKKLSDYFIDKKFSLIEKENQWVMTSGGDICWIVGFAIDDRFKIRENTKHVLFLELQS